MKKRRNVVPGIIITILLFIAEIAFTILLMFTNLLSVKYIGIIFLALLVLLLVIYLFVFDFNKRVRFWIGFVIFILLLLILGIGGFYIHKTVSALNKVTDVNTEVTEVNVYVKQDDAAQSILDTSDYTFGILTELDRENTDKVVSELSTDVGKEITTKEYDSLTNLADGVLNGDCQAIIMNRAYMDVFDEIDNYTNFENQVKVIATKEIVSTVEKENTSVEETTASDDTTETTSASDDAAVTDEVYTIYVSGIDTRGEMTAKSRSDVNIILTVNTRTKQILMISTPRDYYVPLSISNGVKDKLTHAGIYGIDVCMDTMDMLYDINIDYYFRLNFGGFVKIIDALGGITVDSDYDFTHEDYHFVKGTNELDGEAALAFCRERYAFTDGDRQRGKDQMKVIQAVIDKASSPAILKNYLTLLDSLSGCFETSIPYDVISSLVKEQLDEGGSWEVLSYSVNGTGDTQKPYSMSQNAYVMNPDQTTVDKAKSLMQKVREGTVLSDADVQ